MYSKVDFNRKIKVSILVGVSIILTYFKIGIPILPNFLNFDLSDIPIFFIGITFSPILGVVSMGIKNILSFLIMGSFTFGIGEFANFLIGSCFVFISSSIILKINGKKKYVLSFLFGMISLVISGVLLNYFVIIPVYAKILGVSINNIVGEGNTILKFLILYIVPYNVIKSIVIFFPTIFIVSKFKKINSRSVS